MNNQMVSYIGQRSQRVPKQELLSSWNEDVPPPPACERVHQLASSPNLNFLDFHGGLITQTWLIQSLAIGDPFNLQLPPPLPGSRSKTESFNFALMISFLGNQPPSLGDPETFPNIISLT